MLDNLSFCGPMSICIPPMVPSFYETLTSTKLREAIHFEHIFARKCLGFAGIGTLKRD